MQKRIDDIVMIVFNILIFGFIVLIGLVAIVAFFQKEYTGSIVVGVFFFSLAGLYIQGIHEVYPNFIKNMFVKLVTFFGKEN